jgi:hypothetical protein
MASKGFRSPVLMATGKLLRDHLLLNASKLPLVLTNVNLCHIIFA